MRPSLNSVSITDFRSISGTVTVPLNAPVVLVHGPNGAGKTSVLSAIELALTGEILSMRRTDSSYFSHLVYRGADQARIVLDASDLGASAPMPHETTIRGGVVHGGAALHGEISRFFSERAYLAQATLGRLLEIYQNASPREDSALTRFVRDLLGLDAIEALIEGLHAAGDVRNTRRLAPEYAQTEKAIETIEARLIQSRTKLASISSEVMSLKANVQDALAEISPWPDSAANKLPVDMEVLLTRDYEDLQLVMLNGHRRDLASLRQRAVAVADSPQVLSESEAAAEEEASRTALEAWSSTAGKTLESLIDELRTTFPDLPAVASTDPETAFQTASTRVAGELERCTRTIVGDDSLIAQVEQFNQVITQSKARIALVDEQLGEVAGEAQGLSRSLAALIPHIHGEHCPVCGRDYAEVSSAPLVEHVSSQVARLTEQANRIEGLGRTRVSATSDLTKAERDREIATSRLLGQEARVRLKARISALTEATRRLAEVSASVQAGAVAIRREAESLKKLSVFRNRDRLTIELRSSVNDLCRALEQPLLDTAEGLPEAIQRLDNYVASREASLTERQRRRHDALNKYRTMLEQETAVKQLNERIKSDETLKQRKKEALELADRRRQSAKAIARAAVSARTAIVQRVFNTSLNKIWRDLFVRLAPTEPFVPAFRLPKTDNDPITAQLETVHREGGTGGTPGAMLSSGNLNTAALTLFLALHLSVRPLLPWLILDDPVQSMDELHIAQFAALLRTLSKEQGRQIIISVHERPLFDYLTLELSPAFPGDQLVTVEVSRSAVGASFAEPTYYNWENDPAVAV